MTDTSLHGILAAVLTPMKDDLRPDLPAFICYCQKLLDDGCHALAILGSTGEANSIHLSDRLELIEEAARHLPKESLLVGTGSCSLAESIQLTSHALKHGLRSMLVLPPFYYTPISDDGVFSYYNQLIEAVANPDMRIYLYNFPKLTGYRFTLSVIDSLITRHGPIIAGLKDSSGDFAGMCEFAGINPSFKIFAGTERYLLDILQAGGAGCISATVNITAPQARMVWDNHRTDDQEYLTSLRDKIEKYPLVPALKALVEYQEGGQIWRNMLPPFVPLDENVKQQLFSDFEST